MIATILIILFSIKEETANHVADGVYISLGLGGYCISFIDFTTPVLKYLGLIFAVGIAGLKFVKEFCKMVNKKKSGKKE